jgi:hypothetical protein
VNGYLPEIVFVCGAHATGKTSLLRRLAGAGVITRRGAEIGKDLYYERRLETDTQGPGFEWEVAIRELARDVAFCGCPGPIGIETWHPGNLAYAAVRNPLTVERLAAQVRRSPLLARARGIWLRMPADFIKERSRTFADRADWAADFYRRIDLELGTCLDLLRLRERTVEVDARGQLEEVVGRVGEILGWNAGASAPAPA